MGRPPPRQEEPPPKAHEIVYFSPNFPPSKAHLAHLRVNPPKTIDNLAKIGYSPRFSKNIFSTHSHAENTGFPAAAVR